MTGLSQHYSFSTRLILGLLILVLMTTLSAGLPAYWLIRTRLEQQVWSQVNMTHYATLSLFQAEQSQLETIALVLAERPTLHHLLTSKMQAELQQYIEAFRVQSELDLLLVCDESHAPVIGDVQLMTLCPAAPSVRFDLIGTQPALLVSQAVYQRDADRQLGTAVVGIYLDEEFLRQMSAKTGGQHSILAINGDRLASNFTTEPALAASEPTMALQADKEVLALKEGYYYASYFPLTGSDDQMRLISEVALPVNDLIAAENQALAVLIASTGLVAGLGMAAGAWYIRRLTAPLQELTHTSEQISQGDFMARVPLLAGPLEVTTLSAALTRSQAAMLHALEERSQARDWLNTLVQSIVEGVLTFDNQERITFFSQGAETLTGWQAEEVLGQPLNQVFHLAEANGESFVNRAPPPGSKRTIEIMTRGGKRTVLAVTGARLVPPDSDTVQVALVLRDVTEEEALRHLRSHFLANISHEFRTPLSTLNASIELLLDEVEDLTAAEIRELLKPTHLSLLSLQTLIDNLLETSSIEAGHFTLRKRLIDLNQVITDALHIVRPLLERRHQSLSLTAEPAYFPRVLADPSRLVQVLVNLLVNASKYSAIGQPIDVRLEQINHTLRVSVMDRGPGILPADRVNLFHRFVRLNGQYEEQYGIGLGLYLVKTAVEAHSGRVGIDDREGGGSVFWFELPLATGENAP